MPLNARMPFTSRMLQVPHTDSISRTPHISRRYRAPSCFSLLILTITLLPGCTVVKVADVAASSAIGVTVGTVKLTGKAIGAAIPDGDNEDED